MNDDAFYISTDLDQQQQQLLDSSPSCRTPVGSSLGILFGTSLGTSPGTSPGPSLGTSIGTSIGTSLSLDTSLVTSLGTSPGPTTSHWQQRHPPPATTTPILCTLFETQQEVVRDLNHGIEINNIIDSELEENQQQQPPTTPSGCALTRIFKTFQQQYQHPLVLFGDKSNHRRQFVNLKSN